jgi:hypothetical protein
MVDFSEKIVKYFTKLDNFSILRAEKDYLIVGVWITICESKAISVNPMNPNVLTKDKDLPVCFLVTDANFTFKKQDMFYKSNLPIFKLDKKDLKSLDTFEELLDRFINKSFHYF